MYPFSPQNPLPSRLPHRIEQSSLCCTTGPCGKQHLRKYILIDWLIWLHQPYLWPLSSAVVAHRFSCPKACGNLVSWPGIKPASSAGQGRILTTGPLGKSPRTTVFKALPFIQWPEHPRYSAKCLKYVTSWDGHPLPQSIITRGDRGSERFPTSRSWVSAEPRGELRPLCFSTRPILDKHTH